MTPTKRDDIKMFISFISPVLSVILPLLACIIAIFGGIFLIMAENNNSLELIGIGFLYFGALLSGFLWKEWMKTVRE